RRRGDVRPGHGTAEAAVAAARRAEAARAEHPAQQVLEAALAVLRSATAEHPAEHVLEALTSGGEARTGAHRADLVVLGPLLRIRQHGVGLADLLETRLGGGVSRVRVGVVLPRELAVHLLQLGVGDVFRDAEHGIEVLVEPVLAGHRTPLGLSISWWGVNSRRPWRRAAVGRPGRSRSGAPP